MSYSRRSFQAHADSENQKPSENVSRQGLSQLPMKSVSSVSAGVSNRNVFSEIGNTLVPRSTYGGEKGGAQKPISHRSLTQRQSVFSQMPSISAPAPVVQPRPARATLTQASSSASSSVASRPSAPAPVVPTSSAAASSAAGLSERDVTLSPRMDYSDRHNPQCVTEYISDIMCYLKDLETKQMPQADYIARQTEINERMRAILVDWLVEVHFKFKLRQETLFLTISIIDRFLSERIVTKQKLQLVGVTAMLLASKYEEIYAPEVRDFIYISARTYTRDEILKMERIMLSTLGFSLSHPTPYSFLARYKKAGELDGSTRGLVNYFSELALLEYSLIKFTPSQVAATAVYLAQKYESSRDAWMFNLQHYSGFTEKQLQESASILNKAVKAAPTSKLQSVYKKYTSSRRGSVARLAEEKNVDL